MGVVLVTVGMGFWLPVVGVISDDWWLHCRYSTMYVVPVYSTMYVVPVYSTMYVVPVYSTMYVVPVYFVGIWWPLAVVSGWGYWRLVVDRFLVVSGGCSIISTVAVVGGVINELTKRNLIMQAQLMHMPAQ